MSKYNMYIDDVSVEAVFNKLGGVDGARKFLRENIKITVVKYTIDLSMTPQLPFNSAEVVKHEGEGIVEIELCLDDNLYINGKKIELFLSERQKGDKRIIGNKLRQELEDGERALLNSSVLDYIYNHPELFPEHWKKGENDDTRCIFFWGSVFRHPSHASLCVHYLYWGDGELYRDYYWLDVDWSYRCPSTSVAS